MKHNYRCLFFCLLIIANSFNFLKGQNNLQLTNLLQANTTIPSQTITSSYLKGFPDGSVYSNVIIYGNVNFFGNQINTGNNKASVFSKLSPTGNIQWQSYIVSPDSLPSSYEDTHNIDINSQGETIYTTSISNNGNFHSNNGLNIPLNSGSQIIKLSNTGELLWKKSITSSPASINSKIFCFYDRNGDIIVWLGQHEGADLLFDNQPYTAVKSFIAKLDGQTGNLIYLKKYDDLDPWIGNIAFDENNDMYAFYEPFSSHPDNIFHIGNLQINGNGDEFNFFMIKFDSSGNPIFGKNFYENVPAGTFKYSWAIDAKYNGTNFSIYEVLGRVNNNGSQTFLGLNGVYYPSPYSNKSLANEISIVSKTGNVLSSTPIFTSGIYDSNQFTIDESGNNYIYGRWHDKITIGSIEYPMSTYSSNIMKFNSNGVLSYIEPIVENSFSDLNQKISISGNKLFISGNTSAQSIKGQPITSLGGDNYYIGELQSTTLGVQNYSKDEIKVFPNPAYDFIQVESNKELSVAKIYDLSGKLISTTPILFNKIEVAHLLSGNYILEVFDKTDTLIVNKKIIKK